MPWAAVYACGRMALCGLLMVGSAAALCCSLSQESLRQELETMYETDQAQRSQIQVGKNYQVGTVTAEYAALWLQQQKADEANIKRLREITDECGWPRQSQVKSKAAAAAFLVLQHGPLADQERLAPLLRAAVEQGEAQAQSLALLEDRIQVRNGKPQKYGSQVFVDRTTAKAVGFHPIEDEPNVDARRAGVGLGPLAEYAKRFGFEYVAPAK